MSPLPKMGDGVKFQQQWEFRRVDDGFDSSSDDSKSSSGSRSVLKMHKTASKLILFDNDESRDASRPQQNCKAGPGFWVESGNGKAVPNKKRKRDNLPKNAVKRGPCNDDKKKKSKASAYEPAVSGDIKNFMESLLEDLKVTAESLFAWMKDEIHKLEVDDFVAQPERRESDCGVGSIHLQRQNFGKTIMCSTKTTSQRTLQSNIVSNSEGNIPVQHLKGLQSGMRPQNSNGGLSQRSLRRRKAAQSNNCNQIPENQVNFALSEKDKGERLALTVKTDIQSTLLDQNDTMQHQKSVVLAIGAQNPHGGSSSRRKGKRAVNPSNHYEVPEDGDCEIIGSTKPTERNNEAKLGSSSDPHLSSSTSRQVASSMYLTLPSILTEPLATIHSINTPSCNNTPQQRIYGNETSVNAVRDIPILDSSTQSGYFPAVRPVERIGDLVRMGSRGSSTGSGILHYGINSGLNVPSQPGLESLSRGNNNLLGLRMNGGGAIRNLRGTYALPEYYAPDILHNYSSYRADDRLVTFQSSDHKDGCLLPK